MAPLGATGKPVKGDRLKPVVPVLPLAYQQRRAASRQAPKTVPVASKLSSVSSPPQPEPVDIAARLDVTEKADNHEPAAEMKGGKGVKDQEEIQASTPPIQPESETPVARVSSSPHTATSKPNGIGTPKAFPPASTATEQQVVPSPTSTRRPIAPSFYSENNSNNSPPTTSPAHEMAAYPPHVRLPMMHPPMHQYHPSNGSLVFGGFHDSNASSPVPISNGAFPPPNFAPLHPVVMPAVDNYGRPVRVSPSVDGFPPAVASLHEPPTPHSFQGSQSSTHENGQVQYAVMNGQDGPSEIARLPSLPMSENNSHIINAFGPQQPGSASGPGFLAYQMREATLHYLRDAFRNQDFSDCVLEVIFPKAGRAMEDGFRGSHDPLHIPGHRFIFGRSPRLHHLMRMEVPFREGIIRIDINDEYIRPDSFEFTVRTLYGWDLGDGFVLPSYHPIHNIQDDFAVSLGYLAAARYLQLPLMFGMALQRVTRLIDWDTLEQAYKFVFPAVMYSSSHGLLREEYSTIDLLECILAWMTDNITADFVLDTQAEASFSRLPVVDPPAVPAAPLSPRSAAPAVAGHTAYGHPCRDSQVPVYGQHRAAANPRLSHIKFGDISPAKYGGHTPNGNVYSRQSSPRRRPTLRDTILSRVLLNIPFALLKRVLEHPALGKHELVGQARYILFMEIVTEREARRHRALIKGDGKLGHLHDLLERAVEPMHVTQPADFLVNNMGFKEEVYQGDYPYLVHTWTGGDACSVHS